MFLFVSGHSSAVWKCSMDKVVVRFGFPVQSVLSFLLKTESGPILAMFYAPWCGHCKRRKLDYQVAAAKMKGSAVLAAMDVNKPETSPVSRKYTITGFPTLLFFDGGELQYPYPGGNNKEVRMIAIIGLFDEFQK